MPYITPNTQLKLCRNTGLDNSYQHTIYFGNATQQKNYFDSKLLTTLNNLNFIRSSENKIRVQCPTTSIDNRQSYKNVDYLYFVNQNHGNRRYYCFVTNAEYINDVTVEYTFEVDVIQTYLFDIELKECLIERQHTTSDQIGEFLAPEPVSCGEYVYSDIINFNDIATTAGLDMINLDYFIACVTPTNFSSQNFRKYYQSVQTAQYYFFHTFAGLALLLQMYNDKPESVISVYMVPKAMFQPNNLPGDGQIIEAENLRNSFGINLGALTGTEDFEGYVPKNKKLYTTPYNRLKVMSNGTSIDFAYENFENDGTKYLPAFQIDSCFLKPVRFTLTPKGYKGFNKISDGKNVRFFEQNLELSGYPEVSWNNDSYKQWLSYNDERLQLNQMMGYIGAFQNMETQIIGGNYLGAANTGLSEYANYRNNQIEYSNAQKRGNHSYGSVNAATTAINIKQYTFYSARYHLKAENAKIIDDFFTRFGYAINKIQVPNRNARSRFTYLKTNGCICRGYAPASTINKIQSIYNNGITFWNNGNDIGNYSDPNTPNNT